MSQHRQFSYARVWGLDFVSISDFVTISGPFVGAFYRIKDLARHQHPFIIICLKGTSPTNLAEWSTDGTLNFEDAADWLGAGLAHQGFYTALFPSNGDDSFGMMPYDRIVRTIRLIASQAEGTKKVQLFVCGHSCVFSSASLEPKPTFRFRLKDWAPGWLRFSTLECAYTPSSGLLESADA